MDTVADMLTRIRNAQTAKKKTVVIPFSVLKWRILEVLQKHGYVGEVLQRGRKQRRNIEAALRYGDRGAGAIRGIKRISTQGRRMYWKARDMRPSRHGYGVYVVSTSRGVMASYRAQKVPLGGEVLCEVW